MTYRTERTEVDLSQESDIRRKAAEMAENIILGSEDDEDIRQTLEFFMRMCGHVCALSDRPEEFISHFADLVREEKAEYDALKAAMETGRTACRDDSFS